MSSHLDITQSEPLSGQMSQTSKRHHYDPYDDSQSHTFDDASATSTATRKKISLAPSKKNTIDDGMGNVVRPKIKLSSNTANKIQGDIVKLQGSNALGTSSGSSSKIGPIKAGKIVLKKSAIKLRSDSESGKME